MHIFLYTVFLSLYHTAIRIAGRWNTKARLWQQGRVEIFERLQKALTEKPSPIVWLHCSSLGEFEQGRPVLELIRKQYPSYRILLTFFSPSGYEIRKNYEHADFVFYLPADSKRNSKRFLDIVNPTLVLWVKYDYWYYYMAEMKHRNIPVLLISGAFRKDQPFFRWYGRLHRYMLECFRHLFVQTNQSVQLLSTIGVINVSVAGDTRFDRVSEIAARFESIPFISDFCGDYPVVVAGSTWAEDEEEIDHYANTHPNIRFIVAPHDISEGRLKEAEELFTNCIRYSHLQSSRAKKPNVLLIDNIGMLSRLYKYGTITYVGGGFGKDGIHNVLEAAVFSKPVVFGPEFENYIEAVDLVELGAAFTIESAVEIEEVLNDMLADAEWLAKAGKAAGEYVRQKTGATAKVLEYIQVNRLLTT
ncbi:MAG: 3-deoxy-D-manno-octulosonic acid transferase [Chitinophagaceae bacterium]|nr:3-deoxy-D-manno-octulosonic acid transferase [Chitinophagaceae bacterium]